MRGEPGVIKLHCGRESEPPSRVRRVDLPPSCSVPIPTKDDVVFAPNRIALSILGSLAGSPAPSILIYLDDSVRVHPSSLSLVPPSLLPIHFSSAAMAMPRDRASHAIRGRKNDPTPTEGRTDGRTDGGREIWSDRRRSRVPDEIESEREASGERKAGARGRQ